ncbi:uncharacterized protein LOC123549558 [Mercenaria mercenaria]|uniref:uncharacterized protein LOC123549558 n=1 Tax=Mercenaria mercenaria TaxID=6596 RepID=UPI00234F0C38|nr:uncharacterized protein LOC123549558 [Mercenaria mercenaria]
MYNHLNYVTVPNQNRFGDLVGSMGMQPRPVSNGEPVNVSPVTYEGKRKQNLDKKALELESCTQQLQEQMKAEEQAKQDKQKLLQKSVCQDKSESDCGEAPLQIPCQDNTDCGEAPLQIPCQDNTNCGEAPLSIPNKGKKGSKKPDRFCVYCKEIVKNGKLKRHITRNHAKIPEVENILKKGIPVEIQNQFFNEKRKEGISEYNLNLISENKDPAMRERKPVFEDKLRTCAECKGYYSNKYFYKHKCKSSHPTAIKPILLQKVNKTKMDCDKEFQDILNRFVDGQAGDLIRKNTEIQIIGYKHFNMRKHEEGKADEVRKVVMSDMRELARLFLKFQEITGEEKTFEDMFKREHLQDLAEAIQKMVTKSDKTEKHGLKLLLDAIILRSIKTLMGYFSETMQDEKKKELKAYLEAYKYKSSELFPQARQACVKQSIQKSRRPANLPCEMDLRKLQDHIQHNIEKIVNNYELKDYKYLRTLVVSRLTLFNARRGEESPRMLLSEWDAAEKNVWLPEEQIEKISDEAEKFLVGQYKLCYILGKGKKFVPVLIPNDIVPGIRLLVKDRANYNIPESNNFVFATAKGTSHCSGWHALSEVCDAAGVKIPITATGMRHRLSTIYASLNMPAQQQKIFLEHMGHEQHINEDNYQCPRGVQAVKVMGKILKTIEQGSFATVPDDVATDVEQTSNFHKPIVKDQSNGTGNASDEDEDPPMKQRRISGKCLALPRCPTVFSIFLKHSVQKMHLFLNQLFSNK